MLLTFISLLLCSLGLFPMYKDRSRSFFLGKDYTTLIKGICAIDVILVHIPEGHGNILQDAIGSFAYICVTLFFFFSAYGMTISLKKDSYLLHFWRGRLTALLIPCLTINIIRCLTDTILLQLPFDPRMLYDINHYVLQLIGYCIIFYIAHYLQNKLHYSAIIANTFIIGLITLSSVLLYTLSYGWPVECCGLILGTLFAITPNWRTIYTKHNKWLIILAVTGSILLGLCYHKFKIIPIWGDYFLRILLGLVLVITLFLVSAGLHFGNRWGRILGKISFEIYLLHDTISHAYISLWPDVESGMYIFLVITTTIFVAYLLHIPDAKLIEKVRTMVLN